MCIYQNNYIKTNLVGILVKNKANEVHDLEMYFQCIINNCKPPQNFGFTETELVGSFGLKSFHGLVSLAQLEDVTIFSFILHYCIIFYDWQQ